MLNKYSNFLDKIDRIISYLIATMLGLMTGLMVYQIVLRYIFNNANAWSEELIRYLFIWVIMLGGSIAIRKGAHLKVEIFIDVLKPKIKAFIQLISYILILVLLIILLSKGVELVKNTQNNLTAGLEIPMSIPYLSIPIGMFLMILATIEFIFNQIKIIKKEKGAEVA